MLPSNRKRAKPSAGGTSTLARNLRSKASRISENLLDEARAQLKKSNEKHAVSAIDFDHSLRVHDKKASFFKDYYQRLLDANSRDEKTIALPGLEA